MLRALLVALALSPAALAGGLQADQSSGRLEFSATQAGAKFNGNFTRFRVAFEFDAAHPEQGRLDVTVDVASIDTQDPERDEILRGADFFWAGKFPQATYHAGRFERAGAGWRAPGELTIRGVKKPLPVTFTLAAPAGGGPARMKGSASLSRLAFGLGQGEWASTEWIGDAVDVRFELKLQPGG